MSWPAPFIDQGQSRRLSKRKEVNPNLRCDTREGRCQEQNLEHMKGCGARESGRHR